ncbi:MAG: threonine--tRNA ligase [Candidatus Woesearchaeota archaeon]
MKILTLHSDFIKYEPKKKAILSAEEVNKGIREIRECLVVMTAVEKSDEENPDKVIKKYVHEVEDIASRVKTKTIVLYPYAHLSSDLGNPKIAIEIMKNAEEELKKKNYDVTRAPFGWYKEFEIKCKGHPLSELSRSFNAEQSKDDEKRGKEAEEVVGEKKENISEALKAEATLKSEWYIINQEGKLIKLEDYKFKKNEENLKKFANYEFKKSRKIDREPEHVALMKKLQLVNYEPGSDSGNLRYYPKGRLIKKLLEEFVSERVVSYGGQELETPIMYDMNHPTLKRYLNKFPARQYSVESDKRKFFLRFAACFGQFLIAHDAQISYKDMPLKLYELTRYSFRREQRGELTGLRRLRAFTMPDVHALCAGMDQAKEEFKKRFELCINTTRDIGIDTNDFELALRVTKDFYNENIELINDLVKRWNRPALLEIWNERTFYFILKYEFNFIDSLDKASALSTDQVDVENGERYNINYVDKDGKKKHPIILHCSPSGAIERVFYALLEKAALELRAGKTPQIPLWLSPTQIRIIPVSIEKHLKYSKKLLEELEKEKIRVDIDDSPETISKRIRNAEQEWIPYVVVIGDKEIETEKLMTRIREENDQRTLSKQEIINVIKEKTRGMPFKELPLPKYLSKRVIYG